MGPVMFVNYEVSTYFVFARLLENLRNVTA